jgi:hypothetical protein
MRSHVLRVLGVLCSLTLGGATGCGTSGTGGSGGAQGATSTSSASATTSTAAATGGSTTSASGSSTGSGTGGGPPTAADLLALTAQCNPVSNGLYKTDSGASFPADIPICGLVGAVFWKADMDIDCDGKQSAQCNSTTDPFFQAQTSAVDSQGDPLDSAALPYVVIPGISSRFDYSAHGIAFGTVVAVIYGGKVTYAVFGDTGPTSIIGEASYATASALGIDPDPSTGGVDTGVTYIAFTGPGSVAAPIESHQAATTLGESLAAALVASGGK